MNKKYNRNNKGLTPRQKQMIFRKINLIISTIVIAVILTISIGSIGNKAKAADNFTKYYKSIQIQSGDTLNEYFKVYGEHYKSCDKYIKEVCMINSINPNDIKAGNYIILPYYSEDIK